MELHCTRPGCPRPINHYSDLDQPSILRTVQQKFCTACGMPLILDGRYITLRPLAQGGFGAAYLACDRRIPNLPKCVVKLFLPPNNLTAQQLTVAQRLFEREGEVLAELGGHPQIPDLLAFFSLTVPGLQPSTQVELFYLVQEFIDGHTLEEELEQKGNFSETEVREVLQETLTILDFVHNQGSIHRDIKPSNIMHRRDGRLYLLDFGAVKQITASQKVQSSSSTGIYSVGYAPPEQTARSTVYPSTDLYALAVTCVQLLTGSEPTELYDSYNDRWVWHQRVQISAQLTQILDRMLVAAPNQRFQSAADVVTALAPNASLGSLHRGNSSTPSTVPTVSTASTQTPPVIPQNTPQQQFVHFSILELLGGAAFIGFEGALIAIALLSLWGPGYLSLGLGILLLSGLWILQSRRFIEKLDLPIIAGITFVFVVFVKPLHGFLPVTPAPIGIILPIALLTGFAAIALMALFRLIYNLVSRF